MFQQNMKGYNTEFFTKESEIILDIADVNFIKKIILGNFNFPDFTVAVFSSNGSLFNVYKNSDWCKYLSKKEYSDIDIYKNFLCSQNSCKECAETAILKKQQVERDCCGGVKIFSVPIVAYNKIIGSIVFSYKTPCQEYKKLHRLADEYGLDFKKLQHLAKPSNSYSKTLIDSAKQKLILTAELIGLQIEKKEIENGGLIFLKLMDISTNAISINSLDSEFIYVNPSFEKMWNYTTSELQRKTLTDLVSEDNKKIFKEEIITDIINKGSWKGEEWVEKKDGTKFLVSINSSIVKRDNDKPFVILFTFDDITEQEKTKVALEEREITLRNIYDSRLMGFFLWDADGEIIDSNETFLSMVGYSRKEFFSQKIFWQDITPPEYIELYNSVLSNLAEKKDVPPFEEEFICRDDTRISVLIGTIVLPDPKLGGAAFVVDITKRKLLEEHLQQAEKMEAVGHLSGGIAHDFNNVLSIILANTEIALKNTDEGNQTFINLEQIKLACLRAKEVVQQLLFFARKTKPVKRPLKIGNIVKDTLKLLRATIPATITVSTNISENLWSINADPTQINQLLINLCTNATQAMDKEGGEINIQLANIILEEEEIEHLSGILPGKYVEIVISDTGHGIEHENLKKIFEPYFTTRSIDKGTGLGLSVVHGIIKDLNGYVKVDSLLEQETTFRIFFPATEEQPVQKIIDKTVRKHSKKANILFIDDEDAIVRSTVMILEMIGYSSLGFTNPLEAFEEFTATPNKFDLVITDMTMPGMTGDVLSKKILKINSNIPIILCTGFNDKIEEKTAKNIGIKKYIEKPLTESELIKVIEETLQ